MSRYVKYLVQFSLLILFQALILNNITLNWWSQPGGFPVFTPYIYPLYILLIAYLRTNVLLALLPKHMKEYHQLSPSIKTMGWAPFLTYSSFLILVHHSTFFIIELWSLSNLGYLLLKILASALTSMLLISVYLLLFSRRVSMQR